MSTAQLSSSSRLVLTFTSDMGWSSVVQQRFERGPHSNLFHTLLQSSAPACHSCLCIHQMVADSLLCERCSCSAKTCAAPCLNAVRICRSRALYLTRHGKLHRGETFALS